MKYNIGKMVLVLVLVSIVSVGCGGSSTAKKEDSNRTTFDKAYYKSINYTDVDKLSSKFIGKDPRFTNFKTEIPLPTVEISMGGKKYSIDTISEAVDEEGTEIKYYQSENLVFVMYNEHNVTIITVIDNTIEKTLSIAFSSESISEIDDPSVKGIKIYKFTSGDLNVSFPEAVTVNGSATIEYNKVSNFAIIRDGDLGVNVFNKLVDITQNYPNITEIGLKNIDGSVHDDINMQTGLLLRKAGLNTYVLDTEGEGTDIASGGVDLFTAGVKRKIENQETVKLGIHSWAGENDEGVRIEGKDFPKEHKRHHDQLLYFCKMLGVDVGYDFYFRTLEAADADNIHSMTDDELVEYNILN